MTGRTGLRRFGWEAYLTRPILGFGAAGFWTNCICERHRRPVP